MTWVPGFHKGVCHKELKYMGPRLYQGYSGLEWLRPCLSKRNKELKGLTARLSEGYRYREEVK